MKKKSNKLKKYRRNLTKDNWRTFNGWKEVGRHVIKGQKCSRDKDGRAIFHVSQTNVSIYSQSDGKGNFGNEPDQFDEYVENEIFKDNWMFT